MMSADTQTWLSCSPEVASQDDSWKRGLDLVCMVIGFPFLAPLALATGLAIKLLSPGPVLFRQERIGRGGRRFNCLKFRTMVVNADASEHRLHLTRLISTDVPMVKMDSAGDRRLIRFGRLIRSMGLDEVPQIINVLRGEMSLVGPRPCLPYEYEHYLPWQKARFDALPGLTGYWQVSGKNQTTFNEMVQMDIWYARNKSLRLDLMIMLKTVPAVLRQVIELVVRRRAERRSQAAAAELEPREARGCLEADLVLKRVKTEEHL